MKILHIDTGSGWRGGQQQVFWLIEGMRKRSAEQLLLAPSGSPLAERARQEGFQVAALSSPMISFANLRKLRQHLDGFDLLHAQDAHAHSLAWLATLGRRKRPFVVVARRVAFPIGLLSRPKYKAADAYFAVSEYVERQLLRAGVPAGKVHVVPDGVKLPALPIPSVERAAFRRRHGVSEDIFLLGTLTSVAPEKLLRAQIDSLAVLPPFVRLWLGRPAAGTDSSSAETALVAYARSRGLEERFQIFPLGDDVGTFLASLDLFVYLSESEGLGSAILLAMAYGLPVVASRVGGIPEIVRHQKTGMLVDNNLPEELPQAIRLLLGSPLMSQHLALEGRRFARRFATVDIMIARTATVYRELLQEGNSHRA
ncbi:MAG: glycosyltransferase [Acidobacteria bacterium]|nr:glycosyltransferase [Acidobacteriota bacterium]